IVYDALRWRSSSQWVLGVETPRAAVAGAVGRYWKLGGSGLASIIDGDPHAPPQLTSAERALIDLADLAAAPSHVRADIPAWLASRFERSFGDDWVEEGAALALRPPLDLRVNRLNGTREEAIAALPDLPVAPAPWSPDGLRLVQAADARSPAIHAEPAFIKGLIEIQDEGSQLAALFSGALPGAQVVDLCAGAGGKTLALAAMMQNKGQIFATDSDKRRLAPIHERLERAGARNVQVRTPRGDADVLSDLAGRIDLVVIDAPCTGTGSWRRNPDAKWRLRPGALELRIKEQRAVLERALSLIKPGGRIAYITCSLLDEENGAQVRDVLARQTAFSVVPPQQVVGALGERAFMFARAALMTPEGMLMTPRRTGTDGFFVSLLRRA
ncbi:MAG: RsmB/NOP family class I SAM-dependent RNA methyltransferase, partial [Pseudorhodoplanes sp.]